MNKLTLLTVCLFFINSCNLNKNGINVKIINSSDADVSNVVFSIDSGTNIKFDNIKSGETVKGFLDMTNNNNNDGNYSLLLKRESGKIEKVNGGYFTNGNSLDYMVICAVENDTVLMSFKSNVLKSIL